MYDIEKRVLLIRPTVGALIGILKELPPDAEIIFSGSDYGYLHVKNDGLVINLDVDDLDDYYGVEEEV